MKLRKKHMTDDKVRKALENLVERVDNAVLEDGSSLDTTEAHAALGHFDQEFDGTLDMNEGRVVNPRKFEKR